MTRGFDNGGMSIETDQLAAPPDGAQTFEHIDISGDMLRHMRTTMILNDTLVADVKALAAERCTTMTALVDEALRALLREHEAGSSEGLEPPFHFKGYGCGGPQPGVDLTDNSALLDLMEAVP